MVEKLFPYHRNPAIRRYYTLTMLINSWFVAGTWYFIWRHFMTNSQIGLSDGITFGLGFLFELPSGVWADLVGRHIAVRLGLAAMTIGNIAVGFSTSFWANTTGFLIWTLGYTFQSGALDALAYDSLLRAEPATIDAAWPAVIARAQMLAKIMSLTCTLLGGLLYSVWFRLPFLAAAVVSLIGFIIALGFQPDIKPADANEHPAWHWAAYRGTISRGFHVLIAPTMRRIALLALAVGSLEYVFTWGILRPLIGVRFHFTAVTLPVLQVVSAVAVVVTLSLITHRLQHTKTLARLIGLTAFLYATTFIIIGLTHTRILGAVSFIALEVVSTITAVAFSIYLNRHTKSAYRATTLSTVSMLERAPYALLAVLLGWLANNNLVGVFCLAAGAVIFALTVTSFSAWSRPTTDPGRSTLYKPG